MRRVVPAGMFAVVVIVLLGTLAITGKAQRQRSATPTDTATAIFTWHYSDDGTVEYGCGQESCSYHTADPGNVTHWVTWAPTDTPTAPPPTPTRDNRRPTMTCVHFSCTPGDATYSGPMFP